MRCSVSAQRDVDDNSDEEVMWCGTLIRRYPEHIIIEHTYGRTNRTSVR